MVSISASIDSPGSSTMVLEKLVPPRSSWNRFVVVAFILLLVIVVGPFLQGTGFLTMM